MFRVYFVYNLAYILSYFIRSKSFKDCQAQWHFWILYRAVASSKMSCGGCKYSNCLGIYLSDLFSILAKIQGALLFVKALEITRLDITMQPLLQDIFSQLIASSPYFPERFCDFSCIRFPFKTKQKVLSHVNSFWSEIYKKCQKWF